MPGRKIYTSDFQFDYGGIVDDTVAGLKQQTDLLSAALQATERRILAGQQATVTDMKQAFREGESRLTAEVRAVPPAINPNFYRSNPNLQPAGNQNGGYQMPDDHAPKGAGKSGGYTLGEVIFWVLVAIVALSLIVGALNGLGQTRNNWWNKLFSNQQFQESNGCQGNGTLTRDGPGYEEGYHKWVYSGC